MSAKILLLVTKAYTNVRRLRSGWSVHTHAISTAPSSVTSQSSGTRAKLTEAEHALIQSVIERAEVTKEREQRRIGYERRSCLTHFQMYFTCRKLVDRLDTLRNRATGNGVTQCLLCAADFGLLSSRTYGAMCQECRKV